MALNWVLKLTISILACLGAGAIGTVFTVKAIPSWYAGLKKPRYTPPNSAFGPIWTSLYLLMGVSVFLIWQELGSEGAVLAFALFWAQLVLNALWSLIFFGAKSKGGGVIAIVTLWCLILATMVASFRISGWAGALLVPYIVWVSIATYLNVGVWLLNKTPRHVG